jgi:hypothetical protein
MIINLTTTICLTLAMLVGGSGYTQKWLGGD